MKKTGYTRKVKALAALLTAAVLCAAAGCAGQAALPEAGSQKPAAPTATPEPKGVEAEFGRQISITLLSGADSSDLFAQGAQAEADSLGITLETAAGGNISDALAGAKADAVISYLPEPADFGAIESASADVPITVYSIEKAAVGENVSQVYYSPGNEAELAFDAALSYPPHDTPVRLILMFQSADSASYAAYQKLAGEGRIFPKEVYVASESPDTAPGSWLTDKLNGYVEGMLDGVYAENADLALGALDALEALGRTDMEVFCASVTPDTIARMAKNPEVFAQAVGANEYVAGALCVRASLKKIKGEGSVAQELAPCVIDASGLAAGNAALLEMGGEQSKLLGEPWMDTLRSYYETIPN